jgi:hypothetical protein
MLGRLSIVPPTPRPRSSGRIRACAGRHGDLLPWGLRAEPIPKTNCFTRPSATRILSFTILKACRACRFTIPRPLLANRKRKLSRLDRMIFEPTAASRTARLAAETCPLRGRRGSRPASLAPSAPVATGRSREPRGQ